MERKELEMKSVEALRKELAHAREALRDLRFQISQNQQKNVRSLRKKRRDIAQVLTMISEKSRKKPLGK